MVLEVYFLLERINRNIIMNPAPAQISIRLTLTCRGSRVYKLKMTLKASPLSTTPTVSPNSAHSSFQGAPLVCVPLRR